MALGPDTRIPAAPRQARASVASFARREVPRTFVHGDFRKRWKSSHRLDDIQRSRVAGIIRSLVRAEYRSVKYSFIDAGSPISSRENYETMYIPTTNIDQITVPKFRFVIPRAGLPVNRGQSRPRGRVEQENINSPSPRVFSKAALPLELSER